MAAMKTVDSILDLVYGGKGQSAIALKLRHHAPWNWSRIGNFPRAIAFQIASDAARKGIELSASDIPVRHAKKRGGRS